MAVKIIAIRAITKNSLLISSLKMIYFAENPAVKGIPARDKIIIRKDKDKNAELFTKPFKSLMYTILKPLDDRTDNKDIIPTLDIE